MSKFSELPNGIATNGEVSDRPFRKNNWLIAMPVTAQKNSLQ